MEDYQEIKLNKFRKVIVFSFFFISFLSGELFFTKEFCGFIRVVQQKIKIRQQYLNEYNYRLQWVKQYKWKLWTDN